MLPRSLPEGKLATEAPKGYILARSTCCQHRRREPRQMARSARSATIVRATLVAITALVGAGAAVRADASVGAGAPDFDVRQFGAVCDDPTKDSTASFQAALDAASNFKGGTVWVPHCRFWFEGNLSLGPDVALAGRGVGPYDAALNPGAFTQGPTLLPRKSTATGPAFITVYGMNTAVQDLLFFYPEQVGPTASEPDVYPPTLLVYAPSKITGCLLVNSYVGIHVLVGRVYLEKLHIGSYKNDIIVDNAFDVVHISQVAASIFWDFDVLPPQQIDQWVFANGTGITSYKADSLILHDVIVHGRNIGIAFLESPLIYGGTTYGRGSDIDLDAVRNGVVAESTRSQFGFFFTNLLMGPEGANGDHMIWLKQGAVPPNSPRILVNGGGAHGTWRQPMRVDAGTLIVRSVVGVNPIGRLPARGIPAPILPASGIPYVSDLPADGRVMITGGSVSQVSIGGQPTGLTSGMFLVSPGESITVFYSSPPAWSWFLN